MLDKELTPELLKANGYRVAYFPYTGFRLKSESRVFTYCIELRKNDKSSNTYTLEINQYINGSIGLRDRARFHMIKTYDRLNEILKIFPDCKGTIRPFVNH